MTHTTPRFELSVPLAYIDTTIPPGMTIDEYRRTRPQRRSRWPWSGVEPGADRHADQALGLRADREPADGRASRVMGDTVAATRRGSGSSG
jgi:hypothetical protein